ncbi:MAG: glucose-1-phosphate adenylyltransferase [Eubacteriales bacterium]|nr:glucose-1-phosphate adenylyltransferase [Eubacteriales bacterium]
MARQEVVAMILAGGQGSRLGILTQYVAKPAVPFGSRYRIIDFPLSNCTNSGIEAVGVLTQYQPLELNQYMGNGHPWDLDRNRGGLAILPPFMRSGASDWYKGTANAIYQNIYFIDRYNPSYVLILSGDHIYKMNYGQMLNFHIEKGADASIAVIEVPWEEASRFGIMSCDNEQRITKFAEKPAEPESRLASMGIYIFNWQILRQKLIEDEANPDSDNDFGKNIIPAMLNEGKKLYAYTFDSYWRDVGTIFSLWDANMDLIREAQEIDLSDDRWRIYGRTPVQPSHYVANDGEAINSVLTDGCKIYGRVENSVLAASCTVGRGAVVKDSVLMPGAVIEDNAYIEKAIVGLHATIGQAVEIRPDESFGSSDFRNKLCTEGISVIASNIEVLAGSKIGGNSMLDPKLDPEGKVIATRRPGSLLY